MFSNISIGLFRQAWAPRGGIKTSLAINRKIVIIAWQLLAPSASQVRNFITQARLRLKSENFKLSRLKISHLEDKYPIQKKTKLAYSHLKKTLWTSEDNFWLFGVRFPVKLSQQLFNGKSNLFANRFYGTLYQRVCRRCPEGTRGSAESRTAAVSTKDQNHSN